MPQDDAKADQNHEKAAWFRGAMLGGRREQADIVPAILRPAPAGEVRVSQGDINYRGYAICGHID
jgi:hypothetical protein